MKISEMITDRYKLRIPPTVYYELLADVREAEEEQNNLGVDCISRDSAIKALDYDIKCFEFKRGVNRHMDDIAKLLNTIYETQVNNIKALPSTPQEPRKGHWIKTLKAVMGEGYMWYCDKCNHEVYQDSSRSYPSENFCPNCGSDNREVIAKKEVE